MLKSEKNEYISDDKTNMDYTFRSNFSLWQYDVNRGKMDHTTALYCSPYF